MVGKRRVRRARAAAPVESYDIARPNARTARCVLFDHDDTLVSTFPFRAESWEYAVRVSAVRAEY
ncbi:MAG: hypothetical protein U0531_02400 [Dehalococcoidia bacterium]